METVQDSDGNCSALAGAPPIRRPLWEFCEIFIGYALILTVIWTPRSVQHWLYWVAIVWFVFSIFMSFPGWKAMGCTVAGFWRSAWVVGVALILAGAGMAVASTLHTLHRPVGFTQWILAFGEATRSGLWRNSSFSKATFSPAWCAFFPAQRWPPRQPPSSLCARASAQPRPDRSDARLGTCGLPGLSQGA